MVSMHLALWGEARGAFGGAAGIARCSRGPCRALFSFFRARSSGMKSRTRQRSAFTLVEAVVSTSITAVAGAALLLGVSSALDTTNNVMDQAIAQGIADQLADEIAGKRYAAAGAGPYETNLGPSAYEAAGVNRER